MPRIFRQAYTKPIPIGSTISRGRVLIAGKWHVVNAEKTRYRTKAKTWSMEYRDATGALRIESTGCRDRSAAAAVLAETVRRVELTRAGVIDATQASAAGHADTPLADHVAAWLASLESTGRSESYRRCCRVYLAKLRGEMHAERLGHLTYDAFDAWMRARSLSARSRNAYRETLVAFCSWCVATGRLAANPYTSYPVANVAADPRRPRRAFTPAELKRFLAATKKRSLHRYMAYRVMVLTGLRLGELRSLTVADFHGDELRLRAKGSKNRTAAVLPLRSDLAKELARWVRGKPADARLVDVPAKLTRRFDGDLTAAKIAKTERGRTLDVHSLRHTFCTALAAAGVPPRVAQKLMRHSSIRLTMQVYTDVGMLDDRAAVESIGLP